MSIDHESTVKNKKHRLIYLDSFIVIGVSRELMKPLIKCSTIANPGHITEPGKVEIAENSKFDLFPQTEDEWENSREILRINVEFQEILDQIYEFAYAELGVCV